MKGVSFRDMSIIRLYMGDLQGPESKDSSKSVFALPMKLEFPDVCYRQAKDNNVADKIECRAD